MLPEGLFDGHDVRLDLDHQKRSSGAVPGEDVDRATLAVHAVRHLEATLPTVAGEQVHDSPRESRMCLVHQAIEIATAPSKLRWEVGIELAGDPPDLREHHVFEAASLDERDNVLGDTGTVRKVVLAPAESLPERAEPSTDPMIKHARIVRWDAYRAITDETEAVMPRAPWRRFVVARGTAFGVDWTIT